MSGARPGRGGARAQHAVASPTMYTRRDPYVNLLRGTVAGFAAGVGGADAVTVRPFDAALGASTPFSRRIARNTQILLVEEGSPGAGDRPGRRLLVRRVADRRPRPRGVGLVPEIEARRRAGGGAGLRAGRRADRRRPRRPGARDVGDPPHPASPASASSRTWHEKPVPRSGAGLLAGLGTAPGGLPVYRPAAAFEAWRDRSDAILAATGRPAAGLPRHARAARRRTPPAPVSPRNLLQAGGIDTVDAGPTDGVDDVVAAFRDGRHAGRRALRHRRALRRARRRPSSPRCATPGPAGLLAGEAARVDGLDGYVFAGGDALAVLREPCTRHSTRSDGMSAIPDFGAVELGRPASAPSQP